LFVHLNKHIFIILVLHYINMVNEKPLSEIVKDFIETITPEHKASLQKYDMATLEESIRVFKLIEAFKATDKRHIEN